MAKALVGVDTGGTFTDFVVIDAGTLRIHKVLSTPDDPSRAILQGLREMGVQENLAILVHGSTVATNAVLERKGVKTGLITTKGFRDVLAIGRQNRPALYDFQVMREEPLVPRHLRVEVDERIKNDGSILTPLDSDSLHTALADLKQAGVEAVAIVLLFGFINPEHEKIIAQAAREQGWYVSVAYELLPEFREYERTSTVVLNAYVGPLIDRYLSRLDAAIPSETTLRIMQSNGGSISSTIARHEAARTLLSGPAAGVVGAAYIASEAEFQHIITVDIGGTSTDVALVRERIVESTDGSIGGFPMKLPMIDIHTVGAGGGSIARIDNGGALRVGPLSAGADPGPAAYGRGGNAATVTDAHVVLGTLLPGAFLAGTMTLQRDAAWSVVSHLAEALQMSPEDAALGIIRIANANMEAAIRVISVERGVDPREYTLVAFGGAGPLHACDLAASLHIPRVLIPATPGVLSALGMLVADVIKDYVRTIMLPTDIAQSYVDVLFAEIEAQGIADLEGEHLTAEQIVIERFLDMRYMGQSYELIIPYQHSVAEAVQAFHQIHAERFGYSNAQESVQIVNVRLKARGMTEKHDFSPQQEQATELLVPRLRRRITFADEFGTAQTVNGAIYERSQLKPGYQFSGPCLIIQYDTTTVIPPHWNVRVDSAYNLIVELTPLTEGEVR